MNRSSILICAVLAMPIALLAQTAIPGAKVRPIATHGTMKLSSTKVGMCGAHNGVDCLIFQSNDLPEEKPMTVQAVLQKPLTDDQIGVLAHAGFKSATVTCSSVSVSELTNPANGRVMKMAIGNGCTVNELKFNTTNR